MQFGRREARKTLTSYKISLGACRPFCGVYTEKLAERGGHRQLLKPDVLQGWNETILR